MHPIEYAQTIDGWMSTEALQWIHDTASNLQSPVTWVELGVWKGRSWACAALEATGRP